MLEPVLNVADLVPPVDIGRYRELFGDRAFEEFARDTKPHPPTVLGSRHMARELVAKLPIGNLTLDFTEVEIMSPPFAHEILTLRPKIEVTGMNEDVAISWQMAVEHSQPG
jgi:hypothetical protein